MIASTCSEGCTNVNSIAYKFNVYKFWSVASITNRDIQEKWYPIFNTIYLLGRLKIRSIKNVDKMRFYTIKKKLFLKNNIIKYLKVRIKNEFKSFFLIKKLLIINFQSNSIIKKKILNFNFSLLKRIFFK